MCRSLKKEEKLRGKKTAAWKGAQGAAGQGPEDEAEEVSFLPHACTTLLTIA